MWFLLPAFFSAEFTREVTDTQMPLVAPVTLPEMYRIFTMAEVGLCVAESVLLWEPVESAADPRPDDAGLTEAEGPMSLGPFPCDSGGQASGRAEELLELQAATVGRPPRLPPSLRAGHSLLCLSTGLASGAGL